MHGMRTFLLQTKKNPFSNIDLNTHQIQTWNMKWIIKIGRPIIDNNCTL